MIHPIRSARRRGATLVEFAAVCSVTFLLIFGLLIGGLGVYRYQEVAHLAREGARYATTHGGKYQQDGWPQKTGVPAVGKSADLRDYLLPKSNLLESDRLNIAVSWTAPGTIKPANAPSYPDPDPNLTPGQKVITNHVQVTVSYRWMPELYLVGPINLTSTSVMPMSY